MKIGDRVKVVCGSVPRKGQIGTLVGITGDTSPFHFFVDFGKPDDDAPELAPVGLYRGDEFVLLEEVAG